MARDREGGSCLKYRRGGGGSRSTLFGVPESANRAQIEYALTALEELILAGQLNGVEKWTSLLWTNREESIQVLMTRIQQGQVRLPGLTFDVLEGIAGQHMPTIMRAVAADRAVPDLLRLEARRRLPWPEDERRARSSFMRTLQNVDAALSEVLAIYLGGPVLEGAVLTDVLQYVLAMSAPRRAAVIAVFVEQFGPRIAWLLRALLTASDSVTRGMCCELLATFRDHGAMGALTRLTRMTRSQSVLISANAAIRRLSFRCLSSSDRVDARPLDRSAGRELGDLPFERIALTAIDGEGGQVAVAVRRWDPEFFVVAEVFIRDDLGVVAASGWTRAVREQMEAALAIVHDHCPLVSVPIEDVVATIQWATEKNLRGASPLPPEFALWEPFYYPQLLPTAHRSTAHPQSLTGGSPMAKHPVGEIDVARLFRSPFFRSWQLAADESTLASARAVDGLPPQLHASLRSILAQRLRRQAWLLERDGNGELRDVALSVAVGLERGEGHHSQGQAFLRALLERGATAAPSVDGPPLDRER